MTKSLTSVEVERVAVAQLTIDHLPLFVQPTSGRVVPTLKNNVIALNAAGKIIPSTCHQVIFSFEISDDLIGSGLELISLMLG